MNVACGQAEERVLLTGLHAVADIYCECCKTPLGWKYVSISLFSSKIILFILYSLHLCSIGARFRIKSKIQGRKIHYRTRPYDQRERLGLMDGQSREHQHDTEMIIAWTHCCYWSLQPQPPQQLYQHFYSYSLNRQTAAVQLTSSSDRCCCCGLNADTILNPSHCWLRTISSNFVTTVIWLLIATMGRHFKFKHFKYS